MAVAIGKGARLIEGIQSDQTSPAHVELGDGNAVVVELYASGPNPVAQFQLLDSAEPSVGYRAVLDPAGLQTGLTPNTVNKYLVPNVLPYVRIRVTPTSGSWSARVTPVLATQPSASGAATAANQTAPVAPGASPVAAGIPSLLYGADGKPLTYGQTGDRVPTTALTQPRQGNRAIRGRFTPHPVVESKVAVAAFALSGWAGTAKVSAPLNVAPHTRLLLWAALVGAVGSATTLQLQVSFLDQWTATWIPLVDPALATGGLLALDGTKTGTGGAGSGWLTQFPDWLQVTLTAGANSYTAGTLAVYLKAKS